MAGDYTRVTFDPVRGFSGLHKQQGRVSLDWEFNEFEEILDRRDRAETFDAVGRTFVPATTPDAFKIGVGGAGQLTIERGRVYVDGILAECFGDMSSAAATVRDDNLGGVRGPGPVDYDKQPFLYQPNYPVLSSAGTVNLVYLDVWQREVTVFEDPSLREIALNGPDTATRVQTAWQVKVLQNVPSSSCVRPPQQWTTLTAASTGRMTAQTTPVAPAPGPCVINPAGGYTGLENRLYRVEIHKAGTVDGATAAEFKWSRDNASLAARVLSIVSAAAGQSTITVASSGRDAWMRFETGDHIELIDDHVEWAMRESGEGGPMAKVITVNHATGEILIDSDLSTFAVAPDRHPRIRRWDKATGAEPLTRPVNNGAVIPLEDGISVKFGPSVGDTFHAGDYFVFAARTADGTIDLVDNAPPRGVLHHFMQLALITAGSPPTVSSDCRNPPPTEQPVHEGCCTKVVKPGESIQAAIDSLPAAGGCVCLKVGNHPINAPIVIRRSNVTLHGESIGARVTSDSSRVLLRIGGGGGGGDDVGASVHDVMVHDILFRTTNGPPDEADSNRDAIVNVTTSLRISIHDCTLQVVEQPMAMAGVVIFGSREVRIERNVIEGIQVGVRALKDSEGITVRDNLMSGFTRQDVDLGLVGVTMVGVTRRCEVTGNHVRGFAEGVEVLQLPAAPGSLIASNIIERRRSPDSTERVLWAIDVNGAGAVVRDNAIAINEMRHGGIHAIGSGVRIEHNDISSSVREGQPRGILFEGRPVDGWITDNRLRGQLIAIAVLGGIGAQVTGNDLRLNGRGSFGIGLDACMGTLIASNVVVNADQAVLVQSGGATRITGNRISDGLSGIMGMKTEGILIADNVLTNLMFFGVDMAAVQQTTTISRNRFVRCGVGAAESAAIVAHERCDEVVVEFNDVLDTGLVSPGKLVGEVDGIRLLRCARSRVQGNHVSYTAPDALERRLECRALRLEGERTAAPLDGTANNWALILDNSFVGVGLTALVEIMEPRLTRVAFSNNYSEHYSVPNDRFATVAMTAELMTVQGNQTKGQPRTNSFNFHRVGRATFMGNIGFDIIPPASLTPPAMGGFNIVL